MARKDEWMEPRDGKVFRGLIVARISGSQNQKKQSNEDQIQHCKEEVPSYFKGTNVERKIIKSAAKGELLEREEIIEVEKELRTQKHDLMIVEDLGRLLRDVLAKHIFGIAKDHGTRAISINDCVDTADETW